MVPEGNEKAIYHLNKEGKSFWEYLMMPLKEANHEAIECTPAQIKVHVYLST